MKFEDLHIGIHVLCDDGTVREVDDYTNLYVFFKDDGREYPMKFVKAIIHETDLPTDGAPDWYRGKPVYCEFSDDVVTPSFYTTGFCIFNDRGNIPFGMLGGTASGRIEDWNGGIYWKRYARPTTPPKQAKYYILKTVDGKEEKQELSAEQRKVLGLLGLEG